MFSSQFDGFSNSQATQSVSSAKSRESHGLVPVTVKQMSEVSSSYDGKSDVTNVTLVGMLSGKVERVTDVSFALDDGTGIVNCKRWINEAFDTKEMEDVQDGMYVRVNGHLKNFETTKQLGTFSVRPLTKFDEVTFHFIDCIHSHLLNSKSQGDAPSLTNSTMSTPVQNGSNDNQSVSSSQIAGQLIADGLKDCDQLVLEYLQQPSNYALEKGLHMDEISHHLKVPVNKIMESIRSLEEEGLIYSTIDEFHFKSTSSS